MLPDKAGSQYGGGGGNYTSSVSNRPHGCLIIAKHVVPPKLAPICISFSRTASDDGWTRKLHRAMVIGSDRIRRLPRVEFGMQIFTEKQAEKFRFDVLDVRKSPPEELVPAAPVGKMGAAAALPSSKR